MSPATDVAIDMPLLSEGLHPQQHPSVSEHQSRELPMQKPDGVLNKDGPSDLAYSASDATPGFTSWPAGPAEQQTALPASTPPTAEPGQGSTTAVNENAYVTHPIIGQALFPTSPFAQHDWPSGPHTTSALQGPSQQSPHHQPHQQHHGFGIHPEKSWISFLWLLLRNSALILTWCVAGVSAAACAFKQTALFLELCKKFCLVHLYVNFACQCV